MNELPLDRVLRELEAVLDLPEDQALAHIAGLELDDPVLAQAVRRAWETDRRGASLFEIDFEIDLEADDPESTAPAPASATDTIRAGQRIGVWRLIRPLGQGGMGQVWLARRDDEQYRQDVAIKFIHGPVHGSLASEQMRQERQILADLDHPCIARLVDGGVREDGTPWYAMEYVAGLPLDQYCIERGLGLDARLKLIIRIAHALHHAHQRLIVHRDLKPGNILVDDKGDPHLLDFGIAKLLGIDPAPGPGNMTLLAAATPEYAAPEQRRGETVNITADLYALGVITYELLTGQRPSVDPWHVPESGERGPLPSEAPGLDRSTRRRLRGDVDSIVSQMLAPLPEHRYSSAEAVARDIEQHLQGLPVSARRAGAGYRTLKFVRRHWLGVSLGTVAVVALCAALVVSLVQTHRAELALTRANAVQRFLIGVFEASEPGDSATGLVVPRRDLVERAAGRLEQALVDQPDSRLELLIAVGRMFRQLGFAERARPMLEEAVAELESRPADAASRPLLVKAWYELGKAQLLDEDDPAAVVSLSRADSLAAAFDDPPVPRAAILFELGTALSGLHRLDEALAALDQATRLTDEADDSLALRPRIRLMTALTLDRAGRTESAIEVGKQAVRDARRILGPMHDRTTTALSTTGGILRRTGRLEEAEQLQREAVQISLAQYGTPNPAALNNLAGVLHAQGRLREALAWQQQALDLASASFGPRSSTTARYRRNLGLMLADSGQTDQAIEQLEQALADHAADEGEHTAHTMLMRAQLVLKLLALGAADRARPHAGQLANAPAAATDDYPRAQILVHMALAAMRLHEGDPATALTHLKQADTLYAAQARDPLDLWERVELAQLRALTFDALGDAPASRDAWQRAAESAARFLGPSHPLRQAIEAHWHERG